MRVQNAQTNTADFDTNEFWTDAPIALQHSGAMRTDIDSSSNENGMFRNYEYILVKSYLHFYTTHIRRVIFIIGK